jgi:hypothetical protein
VIWSPSVIDYAASQEVPGEVLCEVVCEGAGERGRSGDEFGEAVRAALC